jgi:hypothetical protein
MPAATVKYDSVVELRLPPHLAPFANGSVSGAGNELSRTPVDSRIGETRFSANTGCLSSWGASDQEEFSSRTDAQRTCFRRREALRPAELGLTRKPALSPAIPQDFRRMIARASGSRAFHSGIDESRLGLR